MSGIVVLGGFFFFLLVILVILKEVEDIINREDNSLLLKGILRITVGVITLLIWATMMTYILDYIRGKQ
jgi:hypothetical protein